MTHARRYGGKCELMKGRVKMSKASGVSKGKVRRIAVVINQKGGVGKTTVGFHIAKAAADAGQRVLVIDNDTQGNMSQFLTGNLEIQKNTVGGAGLLFQEGGIPVDAPIETQHPGIWLLHGHEGLDQFDNDPEAEERVMSAEMRQMLRALPFDVIVVDTPPAVGIRHIAPLVWADLAVIPMEPAMASVAGFQSVLQSIEHASQLNPGLQWVGVLNRLNRSARSHRDIEQFVRTTYGKKIAPTLSSRTAIADAMQEEPALPVWRMPGAKRELRELWRDLCTGWVS